MRTWPSSSHSRYLPCLQLRCQIGLSINKSASVVHLSHRPQHRRSQLIQLGARIDISRWVDVRGLFASLLARLERLKHRRASAADELRTSYQLPVLMFDFRLVYYNTSECFVCSWSKCCVLVFIHAALGFPRVADRQHTSVVRPQRLTFKIPTNVNSASHA